VLPGFVAMTWRLAAWPTDPLSLQTRDDRVGRWTFTAHAPGHGKVVVRAAGVCAPPRLCPIAADGPTGGVHGDIPDRGGVISINMLVR
jgi:hypothetical protein